MAVKKAPPVKIYLIEGTLTKASALRLRILQSYVLLRPLPERKRVPEIICFLPKGLSYSPYRFTTAPGTNRTLI